MEGKIAIVATVSGEGSVYFSFVFDDCLELCFLLGESGVEYKFVNLKANVDGVMGKREEVEGATIAERSMLIRIVIIML